MSRVRVTIIGYYDIEPSDYLDPATNEPCASLDRALEIDEELGAMELLEFCDQVDMRLEIA